ncbi:hypothetical protein ACVWYF_004016 [Hymenobacter sp. UYAg731]
MAHAVIRIEKIKTRQGIGQRQAHNDRSKYTPNADEARRDFNQEYLNVEDRPIVELVDKRMEAAKLGKPRKGAVLCLEVLMTGSPEAKIWQRDAQTGQAADMRGSAWEKQNLEWAKREWGDNLVAMKLHQDEKTPHFQCFVVPIFGQGGGLAGEVGPKPGQSARLSARDMFSPPTLSQLQTDFGEAMQPFNLERGIKGSRTPHKTMRQMYALGRETAVEVAALVKPVEARPFVLEKPPMTGRDDWQQKRQAEINAEIARQVGAVNEQLGAVGAMAVAATGAATQSEQSRAWAGDSLQKIDAAQGEIAALQQQVSKEISQGQAERERYAAELDKLLLRVVLGSLPTDLLQRGQELAAQQLEALRREWSVVPALRAQADQAERIGDYALVAELRYKEIPAAEQQLVECRARAQATPAGRSLLAELEEGDRIAKAQEEHKERQAIEVRETERMAQLERSAQEREADRVAQAQWATQEEEAKKARQEAADRAVAEAIKTRHRDTEMDALEMARRNYAWKGEVVRVRVAPDQVEPIQKSIGSFAIEDKAPGADGRVGVNIAYNSSGSTWLVSRVVAHVRATNGEVFERPQDAAQRERNTQSDISRSQGFVEQQGKHKDKGMGE